MSQTIAQHDVEQAHAGAPGAPRRTLSVFDATSIIVGIIIGAGIYETMPLVASNTADLGTLVLVWLLGGFLAVVGAMCYAELATTYPEDGGDYVYLKRAFGPRLAIVFAWAELWIVRPGSIGAMAFIFARYANQLVPLGDEREAFGPYAAGAIIILTAINLAGVREGKLTQNLLTTAKVVGLLTLFAVALSGPAGGAAGDGLQVTGGEAASSAQPTYDYRLALIMVLFTYGGWSEVVYVAAEVRDAKRNILKALLWGIGIVVAVYVTANVAFAHALGFGGLQHSHAVAADVLRLHFGEMGGQIISLLICVSTLGAINGQIFTGARIYYALGKDHPLFAWLGDWNERLGTPAWSLTVQAAATLVPVMIFGRNPDGFRRLVGFNAPVYWFFFLLVGIGLFVLAGRDADRPRPFRVPYYPWTPLLFCAMSGWMCYASFAHAFENRAVEGYCALGILAAGVLVSWLAPRRTELKVES